jgi:ribokinase
MMSSKSVVVFGSTVIDFVAYTNDLPQKGETVFGSGFAKNYGGKGANQAVQASRLGIDVSMCGCVGRDSLGEEYLRQFDIENVDTVLLRRSAKTTGIASINVDSSGANTIVIVPGANEDVEIDSHLAAHIKNARVLICQNEIPFSATLEALQIAKTSPTLSILNPAPASLQLVDLITFCDIICPNETELCTLTSLPTHTEAEIQIAGDKLLSYGCKVVIVTLGEKGAYVATKVKNLFIRTSIVNAIDSTGAGDSFIGTLASNLSRGCSLQQAVKNALFCATISVTRPGAQKSYAYQYEIPQEFQPPSHTEELHNKEIILTL